MQPKAEALNGYGLDVVNRCGEWDKAQAAVAYCGDRHQPRHVNSNLLSRHAKCVK